jgi:hypothetical protein
VSGAKKILNFDEVESTQMTDDRCLTAIDAWPQGMSSRRRRGSKSKLNTLAAMAAEELHTHSRLSLLSLFSLLVLSPSIFFFLAKLFLILKFEKEVIFEGFQPPEMRGKRK